MGEQTGRVPGESGVVSKWKRDGRGSVSRFVGSRCVRLRVVLRLSLSRLRRGLPPHIR